MFFVFFLLSLQLLRERQGAICSLQWPLDDRATLRAIRSLISPHPPLQKGLSSIKVKINDWKRDSKSVLCVRWCLFCGQEIQGRKKKGWLVCMLSSSDGVTQNTASRWQYLITPNWDRSVYKCLLHVILTSLFKRFKKKQTVSIRKT